MRGNLYSDLKNKFELIDNDFKISESIPLSETNMYNRLSSNIEMRSQSDSTGTEETDFHNPHGSNSKGYYASNHPLKLMV